MILRKFLQYFSPHLVETFHSKFSGKVEVLKYQNQFYIRAGQIHQSGGWADTLFHKVSSKFKVQSLKLKKVLILGLAGGTFAKLITKMYPHVNITAVDIDQVMVGIGKKYFNLLKYQNMKIVIDDAFEFVKNNKNFYDLIFVDIFQGDETPKEFSSKEFIDDVVKITSNNGHIMINRLYLPEFKKTTDDYYQNLKNWQEELGFKIINSHQTLGNKVLLLQKV